MALIAQDHRETRLCAHHQDEFKLQLAKFRRAEYTLPWAQSAKPCLWNEYTSQYCYYLDAQGLHLALQVIQGVMVHEGWQLKLLQALSKRIQGAYAYQRRLYPALSQTLPTKVCFEPGSLLQRRIAIEELAREKEVSGKDWEPLPGLRVEEEGLAGGEGEGASGIGTKSFAQQTAEEAELDEKPQPRVHRADVEGDVKSLDRLGERNLYLIVKQNRVWTFPTGSAEAEQVPLHKTALQRLLDSCGGGIDVWLVGRQPIGLYANGTATLSKTFFFKGRILAGQCQPVVAAGIQDFVWFAKEEIQSHVNEYWKGVKSVLSDY